MSQGHDGHFVYLCLILNKLKVKVWVLNDIRPCMRRPHQLDKVIVKWYGSMRQGYVNYLISSVMFLIDEHVNDKIVYNDTIWEFIYLNHFICWMIWWYRQEGLDVWLFIVLLIVWVYNALSWCYLKLSYVDCWVLFHAKEYLGNE